MKPNAHALFKKESESLLIASGGWVALLLWIVGNGCMLWIFSGTYNLLDGGSATLRPFFQLAPLLLLLLVPAFTMRSYAEERRSGTWELLNTHPVSPLLILAGKFQAAFCFCCYLLLYSLPQLFIVYSLSTRGIDAGEVTGGYAGLLLLCAAFCSIGLFASSCTKNAATAYLAGLALCFVFYFGCALLASLFSSGALHEAWESVGMQARYEPMTRGMLTSDACIYFLSLTLLFLALTLIQTNRGDKRLKRWLPWGIAALVVLNLLTTRFSFRWDLTADKRHTLSATTQELLKSLPRPIEVTLYLNGKLNPQFHSLRSATIDLLTEMANYTPHGIKLTLEDPNLQVANSPQGAALLAKLEQRGITPLSVNERDIQNGQTIAQIVFPWAEVVYENDTLPVPLLRRDVLKSASEVLHQSKAELEYGFSDALRVLSIDEPDRIAFVEGHGEMGEPELYQAYNALSRYFQVERGPLQGSVDLLTPYKALIIAAPQKPFTEAEKFMLDQYLMQGGSILLFANGAEFQEELFDATGSSPTAKRELNLDDLLFHYGLRIEPALLQDMQCTPIELASTVDHSTTTLPWFFAPLLLPTSHPITAQIAPLKSEYVSPITLLPAAEGTSQHVLLTTSANSHTLQVPEQVSLRYVEMPATTRYFHEKPQVAAALVEGNFTSAWQHRPLPDGTQPSQTRRLDKTLPGETARLIVASSGSLIRGEWKGSGYSAYPLPLGYEPASKTTLGNEDFLIQCMTYLTHQEQWLTLRGRTLIQRPLSPAATTEQRPLWQAAATGIPLLLLIVHRTAFAFLRRRSIKRLGAKWQKAGNNSQEGQ